LVVGSWAGGEARRGKKVVRRELDIAPKKRKLAADVRGYRYGFNVKNVKNYKHIN
jgi:hypothetical protein